jgi:hypothetical protein
VSRIEDKLENLFEGMTSTEDTSISFETIKRKSGHRSMVRKWKKSAQLTIATTTAVLIVLVLGFNLIYSERISNASLNKGILSAKKVQQESRYWGFEDFTINDYQNEISNFQNTYTFEKSKEIFPFNILRPSNHVQLMDEIGIMGTNGTGQSYFEFWDFLGSKQQWAVIHQTLEEIDPMIQTPYMNKKNIGFLSQDHIHFGKVNDQIVDSGKIGKGKYYVTLKLKQKDKTLYLYCLSNFPYNELKEIIKEYL